MSSHHGGISLENADQIMQDTKAAGFDYLVVPIPPQEILSYDQETKTLGITGSAKDFAKILDSLGKKSADYGLQLVYHNHDFEFKKNDEGEVLIDYLLNNTDPEYVNFEMDIYWVTRAGADPLEYFKEYPGRFVLWHVKDMSDEGNFAPVGHGNIGYRRILAKEELSGMKYYFVEQNSTYEYKPLKAIILSHRELKKIGFNLID